MFSFRPLTLNSWQLVFVKNFMVKYWTWEAVFNSFYPKTPKKRLVYQILTLSLTLLGVNVLENDQKKILSQAIAFVPKRRKLQTSKLIWTNCLTKKQSFLFQRKKSWFISLSLHKVTNVSLMIKVSKNLNKINWYGWSLPTLG